MATRARSQAAILCTFAHAALATTFLTTAQHAAFAQQSTTTLDTITVQGGQQTQARSQPAAPQGPAAPAEEPAPGPAPETAWGPVDGYVATTSASATKTGTPLIETPQSISIVTADQIEAQQAQDLGQALRYVPGVASEPFGFEPRFTFLKIRGLDATTDGLYKDGLQLRNPGYITSYSLEPYGAERIEVPKGPASVLYGAGSAGGLVNYVSKRPVYETFREVVLEPGSHDHFQGKFDFGGHVDEGGKLLYRMTGVIRDSDTQIDFVQDDRIFLAPAITWQPTSRTTLTILAHYQEDETNASQAVPGPGSLTFNPNGKIPTNRFTGEPALDYYDRNENSVTTLFEHVFNPVWTFRQNARYLDSELDVAGAYTTGLLADNRTITRSFYSLDNELQAFNIDNQAIGKFKTGSVEHTLLLGMDYQNLAGKYNQTFGGAPTLDIFAPVYGSPIPPAALVTNYNIKQKQTGLYAQDQIKLTRKWILSLGGRHDWAESVTNDFLSGVTTEQEDSAFTGRAGLVFKTDMGLAPYVSYSESFLPIAGVDSVGNPFDPETGEQYEAGIKYQPPGMESFITAAVFDLTRQNYTTQNATFQTIQTGEVNSQGVELSGTASLTDGLDLVASFTTFDINITKSANPVEIGKDPLQTPETMASLWADYTFQHGALEGFGFGGGVRYISSTFADAANTISSPSVTLADAAVHYDTGNMRLALNVQNLFDKEYVGSCYVRAGTTCTYGSTRNVIGSVKFRW